MVLEVLIKNIEVPKIRDLKTILRRCYDKSPSNTPRKHPQHAAAPGAGNNGGRRATAAAMVGVCFI
jgi:hypothetical protein